MTIPRLTDDELLAAMTAEMLNCEPHRLEVVLRPSSALQLVALLQLALRHPGVDGASADTGYVFIAQVRAFFAERDATAVLEVIRRGDDPEEDR